MNLKSILVFATTALLALNAFAGERTDVHASAQDARPLLPGMTAPAFETTAADGSTVAFTPGEAEKPIVLTFYRGGWCPYCNMHLFELREAEAELRELGFVVWFVSMDKPEVLRPSLSEDVNYTLLSDASATLTRTFGIAFRVDDETVSAYQGYGIDLEEVSGETHHILPVPSTFIIGTDGTIHFQYTNTDYKVRLAPEVLLAAARSAAKGMDGRLVEQREAQRSQE